MIRDLTIERYRSFRHLNIEGLGRVNLITGRNNTGKSSLLEALRILAYNASPYILYDIIRFREEELADRQDSQRAPARDNLFEFSSLFYGFPPFSPEIEPIRIAAAGSERTLVLSLGATWLSEDRVNEGSSRRLREQAQLDMFSTDEVFPGLIIEADYYRRAWALDVLRRLARATACRSRRRCRSNGFPAAL